MTATTTTRRDVQIAALLGVDANATDLDPIARLIAQAAYELASYERMFAETAAAIARDAAEAGTRLAAQVEAGKSTGYISPLGSRVQDYATYATKIQEAWQNLGNLRAARDQMLAKSA